MSIGRVSKKTMIGALGAVILTAAFVLAAVLSAEVMRTQGVFVALELEVSPDPFPDITIGVDEPILNFNAVVINPNPESLNVTIGISLLAVAGCALGNVRVTNVSIAGNANVAQDHDLCLSAYTSPIKLIGSVAAAAFDFEIVYAATFLGSAQYTIQAAGETV